jgi:hypothetical protein
MPESLRGSNGGNARKEKLTPEQRSAIAQLAAQRRWGKKKEELASIEYSYVNSKTGETSAPSPEPMVINESSNPISEPSKVITGVTILSGNLEGQSTVSFEVASSPKPISPPQPKKARPKQMPKAFKGASSYAEKRLAEAIKERAEYMGRVAALNAEIPSLVSVIRALGTSVIPPEALQSYPMQQPTYGAPVQSVYPVADQTQNLQNPIDTALYQANSGPLPGLVPAAANAPMMPNTSVGGAMDLDYVPTDDEGPGLPKMGNGWV